MSVPAGRHEVFGLVQPSLDAHTLGVSAAEQLLEDCGFRVAVAKAPVCAAVGEPDRPGAMDRLVAWLRTERVSRLGFSYRLDPETGAALFGKLLHELRRRRLLAEQGGPLRAVYFAGLPAACERVAREQGPAVPVFRGDETPGETLDALGVPRELRPRGLLEDVAYDDARMRFGRDLLRREKHRAIRPVDRTGCPGFGTPADGVVARLRHSAEHRLPPLMRAHVGPYLPDRVEAVHRFLDWTRELARGGLLDVLSIGTSQLTQSSFGEDWGGRPNGGGVPLNSAEEFRAVWQAARPMLVRTYAGTTRMPELARLYEETLNIAWHAFSFWWFSRMDGRGPYPLAENLRQHLETLRYVAESGKPFEPNVPHHFAFRGADDVTYVVSGVLAARAAKRAGVRHLVLQVMLNTPSATWGVQDLAKSRALLALVRELEDEGFRAHLQPRAGLDYFAPDLEKARAQLAAVTALMDDIEPGDPTSPGLIHVVSYCEASHLADPAAVNESIQITRAALEEYRRLRAAGEVEEMSRHPEALRRTQELVEGARAVLRAIDRSIDDPCSAEGLYRVFAAGFLPVPYLWECREEFPQAVRWRTRVIRGAVQVVDERDRPIASEERAGVAADWAARAWPSPAGFLPPASGVTR